MQNHPPKVALITGAARRIGAEIARELHQAGINIVVHYHTSQAEAEALCADLNRLRSHSAVAVQADLAQLVEINTLVLTAQAAWGRLDILINNASRFYKTPFGDVTEAVWDDLLNTNLKAAYFLAQQAAVFLKMNQGCIVNVGDIYAERPLADYSVYTISKAGLLMVTKALAQELAPWVRVNTVAPAGGICWPEGENSLTPERMEKIIQRTALKRAGSSGDVAKAVRFLVLEAGYVTGQVLGVDGGR